LTEGRILIAAVTGVNGKTTTTRLLTHLLRQAGYFVGMTCTDGTYLDGRRTETRDCSGPRSARSVLLHPHVEAAVFETARGGILREGLGFEECDVAIVTNVGSGDHLGLRGVETPQELALVKRTVVEAVSPGGAGVLNAADPLVAAMAGHCAGTVIFFAREGGEEKDEGGRMKDESKPKTASASSFILHPSSFSSVLVEHCRAGGRAVFSRGGSIVLADGGREETLLALERVPLTHDGKVGFQVENVLAATAAAWALGLPLDTIRAGLESFVGDARQSPGRYNVFRVGEGTVVVDFAHNVSALAALVQSLDAFPHARRTAVFTAFDRRDTDVIAVGEVLGRAFDRVVLVNDRDGRERAEGELSALVRRGLARGARVTAVHEAGSELQAADDVLRSLRPDDLVVLGVKAFEAVLAIVEAHLQGEGVASEDICAQR
jgi:cyanophycin synthetase